MALRLETTSCRPAPEIDSGKIRRPMADRFWSKVNKTGPTVRPELGQCWTWIGSRQKKGHGHIRVGKRTEKAHRVSYFLHHGRWPEQWVLHKCDNSSCVNPKHLYEGTPQNNVDDRDSRSRFVPLRGPDNGMYRRPELAARGESHGMSKLTESIVSEIRRRFFSGERNKSELARRFGVHRRTIHSVLIGGTWSHVEKK